MQKKIYSTWGLKDQNKPNCLVEGLKPITFSNGEVDPDCEKLFWTIEACTEEEAKAIYYLRQGWHPFLPNGEATNCSKCGETIYRSESGQCWNCGNIEEYIKPKIKIICNFKRLEKWFLQQCDDNWEHSYGVEIKTLDNPGWEVRIDLDGTKYENIKFNTISENMEAEEKTNDWIHCRVKSNKFTGYGGPEKLDDVIKIFMDWIEEKT